MVEPLTRLSEDQLENALDGAVNREDHSLVARIVDEMDRRGQMIEV